jgi:regulator of protease activity HflC (stomatin/prohibitin superfamily)
VEGALAWIGAIAEWFGRFIPRRVILDTTQGAIKYKRGSQIVVCGPGLHWYWPWSSTFVDHPTARQTDRLETQVQESKDGKTFIVGAMITYTVEDLEKFVTNIHSPLTTVVDIAMTAVHDVCADFNWEDLQAEQRRGTLKTKLKNEAQKQLQELGLRVIKFQLTSLARCRVLKVSQSVANEEN